MLKKINWQNAIGEILIVLISILIAFALNKYAENLQNKKTKKLYINSLISDLDSEIDHLEGNLKEFEAKIATVRLLMPYLKGKLEGRDTIISKIFGLGQVVNFDPHDISYRTLVNTGDFKLFTDFELKRKIEAHYSGQEQIKLDYRRQYAIQENYFSDFVIFELDYDQMGRGDFSFMDKKILRNIVQSLFGTFNLAMAASRKEIEQCKALKQILLEK